MACSNLQRGTGSEPMAMRNHMKGFHTEAQPLKENEVTVFHGVNSSWPGQSGVLGARGCRPRWSSFADGPREACVGVA